MYKRFKLLVVRGGKGLNTCIHFPKVPRATVIPAAMYISESKLYQNSNTTSENILLQCVKPFFFVSHGDNEWRRGILLQLSKRRLTALRCTVSFKFTYIHKVCPQKSRLG